MYHQDLVQLGKLYNNYFTENESNNYHCENEKKFIIDDLKYNLSKAISEILTHTRLNYLTINSFCHDLKEYNHKNNTFLRYKKFLNYGLIQEINGSIKIIKHNGYPYTENKYIAFIKNYQPKNSDPSICKKKFECILKNYHIPLDYLEKYTNLKDNKIHFYFSFFREIYCLTDKIFYHLWIILKGNNIQQFSKIIQHEQMWVKPFHHFLSEDEYLEYFKYVTLFISKQQDLLTSRNEFLKIVSDYPSHYDINKIIDNMYTDEFIYIYYPPLFLNNLKHSGNEYYDINFQPTRRVISRLLETLNIEHEDSLLYILSLTKQKKSIYLFNLSISLLMKEHKSKVPFLVESNPLIAPHIFNTVFSTEKISEDKIILEDYNFENINHKKNDIKIDFLLNWLAVLLKKSNHEIGNVNFSISKKYSNHISFTIAAAKIISKLYDNCFSSNSLISYHGRFREKINKVSKIIEKQLDNYDEKFIYSLIKLLCNERSYKSDSNHHAFIQPKIGLLHFLVDISKILSNNHQNTKQLISDQFIKEINFFFNTKTLKIVTPTNNTFKNQEVTYGFSTFAFESVEWHTVFEIINLFGNLNDIYDEIFKNISIKANDSSYHEHNMNQKKRIIFLFKAVTLAYTKTSDFHLKKNLNNKIKNICLKFNQEKITEELLNIFDYNQGFLSSRNDIYYQSTKSILYDFINTLKEEKQEIEFINSLFQSSTDLNFLLEAKNKIFSEKFKNSINEIINKINIDVFLDNVYTITEIENTIVNSANSDSNYSFAKNLLPKILEHYTNRKYNQNKAISFTKNIELLIAFKEENILKIEEIISEKNISQEIFQKAFYYKAIYPSYHQNNWDETLRLIESLPNKSKNIDYNFQKFRCIVLDINKTSIQKIKAFNDFESFLNNLRDEDLSKFNTNLSEYYHLLKIIPLSLLNRNLDFITILNNLNNNLKYNEETLHYIYNFFINNKMIVESFEFISSADSYYKNINHTSHILEEIFNNHNHQEMNLQIGKALALLPSMNYKDLAKVYPLENTEQLFKKYQYFILLKIVTALKLLVDKRVSIKKENEYNDLLLILLKFKFAEFGWSFDDQPRSGTSSTKKDAGEIDIAINYKNNKIALIEAFRLINRNTKLTQAHAHKTSLYAKNLSTYYMVVYFIGNKANFESTWNNYKDDFLSTTFEHGYKPLTQSFEELNYLFDNINRFYVAKTQHESNIIYFHIMVDFSL